MAQVFPPGLAPKVPTSIYFPAAPVHIHTCKLRPLLSPLPKPSREQLRQPGEQTLSTSATPHPAPHPLYAKWKESPSLCLARSSQQERQAQQCPKARQPGLRGGDILCLLLLLWGGSPTSWPLWLGWPAASTSFWTARCCWVPKQQKTSTSTCA